MAPPTRMPAPARIALATLAIGAAFSLVPCVLVELHGVATPRELYAVVALEAVLMVGIAVGDRLARQLGRPLAALAALYLFAFGRVAPAAAGAPPAAAEMSVWALVAAGGLLATAAVALTTNESRKWFRLLCPSCEDAASGADPLYREACCERCHLRW